MIDAVAAISAENLEIGYKKRSIAFGLNLSLKRGEVTALLGKNGVGKSTLIKTLTGLLAPLAGKVEINGQDIGSLRKNELATQMALVTTEPQLVGGLTVREVVSLGRQPYTGMFGHLNSNDREIVHKAMVDAGILHKEDSYIAELSDGERQKAMIARALAQTSSIIIMDEPFSFLDVEGKIELLTLLKKIADRNHSAILFSTHDISQALRMADKIWMFATNEKEGKRIIDKTPLDLIASGDVNKLFNTESIIFDTVQNDFIAK